MDWHAPATQFSVGVQVVPHAPQVVWLVASATHAPLQFVWPGGQVALHAPFTQAWPLGQS
jgi:hypothetical protein